MQPVDEVISARLGIQIASKWTLVRLLGVGGMAAVYAARDASGNEVAVKLLHPEMSRKQGVRERFLREASVANRISHPGAVRVLEQGSDPGGEQTFLIMELLRGEPLNERFRRAGKLPVSEVFGYLDEVLDVLVAAHDIGIIHRDLKPDNLFLTEAGQLKVLDFGLARMLDSMPGDFTTKTGVALGTLPYMAPEQALGRRSEIDGRVDLFALGASAFRMLSGRKVHETDSEAELLMAMASKPAPSLGSVAPEVGRSASAVIDLSLAFSRDARYPNARAMQEDVRAVRAGKPPPFATQRSATRDLPTALNIPAVVLPPASVRGATGTPTSVEATAPDRTLPDPTVPDRALPDAARAQPPSASGEPAPPSSQLGSMTVDLGPRAPVEPAATAGVAAPTRADTPRKPASTSHRLPTWAAAVVALSALTVLGVAIALAVGAFSSNRALPAPLADSAHSPSSAPTESDRTAPPDTATAITTTARPTTPSPAPRATGQPVAPVATLATAALVPAPAPTSTSATTTLQPALPPPAAPIPAPAPAPPPPGRDKPGKSHKHH